MYRVMIFEVLVRALALEKKVAVFFRWFGRNSDFAWNKNFKSKCSFRGTVPKKKLISWKFSRFLAKSQILDFV